jgi:hypothetical protein
VAASGSSSAARLLPSMAPMFLLRALAEADCNKNGPEEPESNASSSLTLLEDPMDLVARGDGVADDGIRCVTGGLKGLLASLFALVAGIAIGELTDFSGRFTLYLLFEVSRVGKGFDEDWRGAPETSEFDGFDGVIALLTAFGGGFLRWGDGDVGEGGRPSTTGFRDETLKTGLNRTPSGNADRLTAAFSICMSCIDSATFKLPSSPSFAMFVGVLESSDAAAFLRSITQSKSTMGISHSFAFAHLMPSLEGQSRWVQWDEKLSDVLMPKERNKSLKPRRKQKCTCLDPAEDGKPMYVQTNLIQRKRLVNWMCLDRGLGVNRAAGVRTHTFWRGRNNQRSIRDVLLY